MVEIEIDGKALTVAEGSMIIEAADNAGIYIPRYCYHRKLSIAANCRMCLVEVEKVGKPLPACATPITPGMKVFTQSQKALQAQRAVMEFLLINHPLDCPICDQGGECELQDLSMGFGRGFSTYNEPKRSVYSENIGPLIETWMTRCIHCTRCVRFGEEIAGLRELGATGRGEDMEIGTYVKHFLRSEVSGNIIDICPVGALTNKPARYAGRSWEYREHPMIGAHDAFGANTFVHTYGFEYKPQREVMRAVPRENEALNETWMSDRDRYGVHGLYHEARVYKPLMKKNDEWVEVEWDRALLEIADRTHAIAQNQGPAQIAAIANASSTIEEFYLLQKMLRALGSNNVDYRYREHDFSDQNAMPLYPGLDCHIADLEEHEVIVILGTNVRYEMPLLNLRLRKDARLDKAKVYAMNSKNYSHTIELTANWLVPAAQLLDALAQVTKAVAQEKKHPLPELSAVVVSEQAREIALALIKAEKSTIIFGEQIITHRHAAVFRSLLYTLKKLTGTYLGELTAGANAAGAYLAGMVPHRLACGRVVDTPGKNAKALLTTESVRAYFLLGVEPELDFAYGSVALANLEKAGLVVCMSTYTSEQMKRYADFILPISPFTESGGTYVNLEGRWQTFNPVSVPCEESRPAWKVLRVLANFMQLDGFDYKTVHEVQQELQQHVEESAVQHEYSYTFSSLPPVDTRLMRLAPWLMYRVDPIVRHSVPLQEAMMHYTLLSVNSATAQKYQLNADEEVLVVQAGDVIEARLTLDERLADDTVWLPSGIIQTAAFGDGMGAVELKQIELK